ncbi:MAG: VWA domain-containing protein [Nannocystaceae bacterium]
MRSWLTTILLTLPLSLPGCRTSGTVTPIVGEGPGTGGSGGDPVAPDPGANAYYSGPAHVFTPRSHPSHARLAPPPPDLRSLPRLVDNVDRCYGRVKPAQPIRPVTKKSKAKTSAGYKNVPYGGGGSAPPSTASSSNGVLGGVAKGSGSGYGRGSGAGMGGAALDGTTASAPSMPPPASAPAPEPEMSRGDAPSKAKEKRDKRRSRKDRAAAKQEAAPVQMAEAEEAMAYDDADVAGGDVATATPGAAQIAREDAYDQYNDWGQAIYLSNDDTMSLSSAQRILYAIDRYLPLPPEHIRPHELLNYFSFHTVKVAETDDFSVLANIAPNPDKDGIYDLALAVKGRPMDRDSRRNGAVTLVIDRSGSMSDEGRMNYLKQGLKRMVSELKPGDLVNMVIFDHNVCTPLENFVVGRDRPQVLERAIDGLLPRGSTDLYSGLSTGYQLADRSYQPTYSNRVMLITDALTNTGVTDSQAIAMVGKYYDDRRIRLSGIGVGSSFNDELLDSLTERGKGAYVFLGSEAEVDAVFGGRFISLLETTALDVHFQLHLPPSLRMNVFYGEEASAVKEEVQAIHYFANTSQLFFSELMARGGKMRPEDWIMLTVEYEDPETGAETMEEVAWNLGDIAGEAPNVDKARMLMTFVQRLGELAYRPPPSGYATRVGGWYDQGAWQICEDGRMTLERMEGKLGGDPEATRVRGLWSKMCSRYQAPQPVARPVQEQPDAWPGAQG